MTPQISRRELENLSAYLDNELEPKEKARLEAGLEEHSELRSDLEDLRKLRKVIRSQPHLRAPRQFTLTPEMAGIRPGFRWLPNQYPVLRLASLIAAFFFFVILAGDFYTSRLQPMSLVVSDADQRAVLPPFAPGFGGGGGGSDMASEAPMEQAIEEQETLVEGTPASLLAPEAIEQPSIQVTPQIEKALATPPPMEMASPQGEQFVETPHTVQTVEGRGRSSVWAGVTILRVLEIVLMLLALVTGLAAIYIRRAAIG